MYNLYKKGKAVSTQNKILQTEITDLQLKVSFRCDEQGVKASTIGNKRRKMGFPEFVGGYLQGMNAFSTSTASLQGALVKILEKSKFEIHNGELVIKILAVQDSLSDKEAGAIAQVLQDSDTITSLNFKPSNISRNAVQTISDGIKKNTSLRNVYIELGNDLFKGLDLNFIFEMLGRSIIDRQSPLERLRLNFENNDDRTLEDAKLIGHILTAVPVKEFVLAKTPPSAQAITQLADGLVCARNMESLRLHFLEGCITDNIDTVVYLAESIQRLPQIKTLILGYTDFEPQEAEMLGKFLGEVEQLEEIDVTGCTNIPFILKGIARTITDKHQLRYLKAGSTGSIERLGIPELDATDLRALIAIIKKSSHLKYVEVLDYAIKPRLLCKTIEALEEVLKKKKVLQTFAVHLYGPTREDDAGYSTNEMRQKDGLRVIKKTRRLEAKINRDFNNRCALFTEQVPVVVEVLHHQHRFPLEVVDLILQQVYLINFKDYGVESCNSRFSLPSYELKILTNSCGENADSDCEF